MAIRTPIVAISGGLSVLPSGDAINQSSIATASAVSVGTTNAEGSSSQLARADHTHQVTGLTITSQAQGDILYFNGTSWVRLAAGTSGQFLQTQGAGANPQWATPAGSGTSSIAEATGNITTTSTSDVLATGMTLTPASGTYLVWFSTSVSNNVGGSSVFVSIYASGIQVAASERVSMHERNGDIDGLATAARVTVNGSQAIEARWRVSGNTGTMRQRTLLILKV